MKENELTIKIPAGQEIDWQESAKQEKIVFKKKNNKPRSWEEYCENHRGGFAFISTGSRVSVTEVKYPSNESFKLDPENSKHVLPSKELAEAFLAMMQLCSLRESWIGDWKPDWKNFEQPKASISCDRNGELIVLYFKDLASRPLSFPTYEMAEDFMTCFKDLLEIAKPLI